MSFALMIEKMQNNRHLNKFYKFTRKNIISRSIKSNSISINISRRHLLKSFIGLLTANALTHFRYLSVRAKDLLICLEEFDQIRGATLDRLTNISDLDTVQVKNAITELTTFSLVYSLDRGEDRIFYLSSPSNYLIYKNSFKNNFMDKDWIEQKRKEYALKHTKLFLKKLKIWSSQLNTFQAYDAFKNIERDIGDINKALTRLSDTIYEIPPEVIRDFAITLYEYYDKRSNWQEWLKLGELGLKACKSLFDDYSLKEAYPIICNCLGISYRMLSNYDKAMEFYKEALSKAEKNELKSDALVNIADIYRLIQNYERALEYAERAIELGFDDINRRAKGLEYQGLTYRSIKEYDQAIDSFKLAVDLRTEIENLPRLAVVLEFLSSTLILRDSKEDLKEAIIYSQQAIKIAEEIKDKQILASSNMDLGYIYVKRKNYEKAIKAFLNALDYRRGMSFHRGEVNVCLSLAYCYFQCNHLKEAAIHAWSVYQKRSYLSPDDQLVQASEISQLFTATSEYLKQHGGLFEADLLLNFSREFST